MGNYNNYPTDFDFSGHELPDCLSDEQKEFIMAGCERAFRRGFAHGAYTALDLVDPKNKDKFMKAVEDWRFPKKKKDRFSFEFPRFERFYKNEKQ